MTSSALKILVALCILAVTCALPQDRNYIRTQRKLPSSDYGYNHNRDAISFPDAQDLYPETVPRFRPRAMFDAHKKEIDYEDMDAPPLDFKPVHAISSLNWTPPKVNRKPIENKIPEQQPGTTTGRPPTTTRRPPTTTRPAPPAQAQPRDPRPQNQSPGKRRSQPKHRLSDCGGATVRCCNLLAGSRKFVPRCFEEMGCAGAYYDAPCSLERQRHIRNYLGRF